MADKHEMSFPTRYGELRIPNAHCESILGQVIVRVHGPRPFMVQSGCYSRPLLAWHTKHRSYSRFRDLHSLLRTLRSSRDWEGVNVPDLEASEHARLMSWLAAHEHLRAWASQDQMSPAERKRFEDVCTELGTRMGRPVDDIKIEMQELTLRAALGEDPGSVALLTEAMGLGKRRVQAVRKIANRVNIRALAVLREIVTQQEALASCHETLPKLLEQHHALARQPQGWRDRPQLFTAILELEQRLEHVRDRPLYGLACRTRTDLNRYLEQAAEQGAFQGAHLHLERALAGRACAQANRQANAALFLLTLATRRGQVRKDELTNKVQTLLIELSRIDPTQGDLLVRNPLWTTVGNANDALRILRSGYPNWEEVKDLLYEIVSKT